MDMSVHVHMAWMIIRKFFFGDKNILSSIFFNFGYLIVPRP